MPCSPTMMPPLSGPKAETARTHALAEDRRELWFARLFFVGVFEVDAPDVKPDTRALAAPAISDRVEKPEVDLSRLRGAREDPHST